MARTSVAASRGLDAIGINPANLAYEDDATVTLSLFPVGVGVGSNFLTYGMYNKFFTGVDSPTGRVAKNLSEGDKQELLNAFPGGIGTLGADAEIRPIGLAIRFGKFATFALTTTERVAATGAIPSSYAKFCPGRHDSRVDVRLQRGARIGRVDAPVRPLRRIQPADM